MENKQMVVMVVEYSLAENKKCYAMVQNCYDPYKFHGDFFTETLEKTMDKEAIVEYAQAYAKFKGAKYNFLSMVDSNQLNE